MKLLLLTTLMLLGQAARAETIQAEEYTYALGAKLNCDIARIPEAAQVAINAAIAKAKEVCPNAEIRTGRILSIEPTACRTRNAGFNSRAEVEFNCPK